MAAKANLTGALTFRIVSRHCRAELNLDLRGAILLATQNDGSTVRHVCLSNLTRTEAHRSENDSGYYGNGTLAYVKDKIIYVLQHRRLPLA